jgi:hypothetical protein
MPADGFILGDEGSVTDACMSDNQAVKRIPDPLLGQHAFSRNLVPFVQPFDMHEAFRIADHQLLWSFLVARIPCLMSLDDLQRFSMANHLDWPAGGEDLIQNLVNVFAQRRYTDLQWECPRFRIPHLESTTPKHNLAHLDRLNGNALC